jgi:hypothetical protein
MVSRATGTTIGAISSGCPRPLRTSAVALEIEWRTYVRANNHQRFPRTEPERSPNVHDSLTLTHSGPVGGGAAVGASAARETPPEFDQRGRPAERCAQHAEVDGDPGPCRSCGDARKAAAGYDHRAAHERQAVIRACPLCDIDGWRYEPGRRVPMTPYVRCDHAPLPAEEASDAERA